MKLNIVKAKTGSVWVRQGFRVFWTRPLALSGLFFMFMASMSVLAILPILGNFLALMLIPAGTVGLMAATREVDAGKFPMPLILFTGFRSDADGKRKMLILGLVYACGFVGIMGLSVLIDGGHLAQLYLGTGEISIQTLNEPSFQYAIGLALLLYMALSMMFWYAPALTHWYGVPVLKSLFFSTVVCLSNWRAFLVYNLLWSLIFVGTTLGIVLISGLLGDSGFAAFALMPAMLLLVAIFFCSIYYSFTDCFTTGAAQE